MLQLLGRLRRRDAAPMRWARREAVLTTTEYLRELHSPFSRDSIRLSRTTLLTSTSSPSTRLNSDLPVDTTLPLGPHFAWEDDREEYSGG